MGEKRSYKVLSCWLGFITSEGAMQSIGGVGIYISLGYET